MRAVGRSSPWVGFAGSLLGALALAGLLNLLTYLATLDAPAADGPQRAGFPLTFWWSGGLTPPSAPTGGTDPTAAAVGALLAVVAGVSAGLAAGFLLPVTTG